MALLPGPGFDPALFALACALTAALLVAGRARDRNVRRRSGSRSPTSAIIALMRQAGDGPSAGFLPLVILPVVWLALYGSRRQLLVVLGVAALVLLVPWALVGGARYPPSTTRSALLVLAVAALAGLTIQRLLGQVRTRAGLHRGDPRDRRRARRRDRRPTRGSSASTGPPSGSPATPPGRCADAR